METVKKFVAFAPCDLNKLRIIAIHSTREGVERELRGRCRLLDPDVEVMTYEGPPSTYLRYGYKTKRPTARYWQ